MGILDEKYGPLKYVHDNMQDSYVYEKSVIRNAIELLEEQEAELKEKEEKIKELHQDVLTLAEKYRVEHRESDILRKQLDELKVKGE